MKITMYELLGMVKEGKTPKKIKYNNSVYIFNDTKDNYYENETCSINWDYVSLHCLNEPVEILEEEKKIPEKIKDKYCSQISKVELAQKYNEIIDYLDYLKSKGE